MKVWLCYVIWNKNLHIPWLCEGIKNCIPPGSHIDFIFDHYTDNSKEVLMPLVNDGGAAGLKDFEVAVYESNDDRKYRWPNTNDSIKRFMESDCDIFLSPQDDQKLQDRNLIHELQSRFWGMENSYTGKKIIPGIIGMRDGIDEHGNYFSSQFSKGGQNTTWLKQGQSMTVKEINDGPIALIKSTIEKIGLFDEQLWVHYNDRDYSYRCNKAGLQNYVLGIELIHEKWHCQYCHNGVQASEVWSQDFSEHDYEIFKKKWL